MRSTTQIQLLTRHQFGISALRRHFAEKPLVVSRNVGCFLAWDLKRLVNRNIFLFRTVRDSKMSQFFARDFTVDRWRKAALKNAYSLLGKQRFDHAAAFFLLAGSLWDAIQVSICGLLGAMLHVMIPPQLHCILHINTP